MGESARGLPSTDVAQSESDAFVVLVDRIDAHLVVHREPRSALAEQYRSFRTNLVALNPDGAPRALTVTSAIKGEGKTLTAANLALALVELPGTRTLLLDADLRTPGLASLFGLADEPGLSDLVLDALSLDQVVKPTGVPNLSVLPAGRAVGNPSELLGSARIGDLLSALKAEYNYILIDTPPALPYADATVLSSRVDGCFVVVRMEKTPKEQVEQAIDKLRAARSNVIGCFLAGSRSLRTAEGDAVIDDD